jgi:hypothetical protein
VFTARYGLNLYTKFYVLPTQCIYVFSVDLRTNSDYFTTQNLRYDSVQCSPISGTALFLAVCQALQFVFLVRTACR